MKAILVVEMPTNCKNCDRVIRKGCIKGDYRKEERPKQCPLSHPLKGMYGDFYVYDREYLFANLEREYELLKEVREYESNISN